MKKMMRMAAGLVAVCAAGALAAEPAAKVITIVNAQAVSSNVLEQVRAFAEAQLYVPVRAVEAPAFKGKTLDEIAQQAAKTKQPNTVALIALVMPEAEIATHELVLSNLQVAVVNVKAMKDADQAKLIARVERQVMRGSGSLFGLGSDVDPHCVMHPYKTLADLDRMGLNFSPPWLQNFRAEAERRGMEVRSIIPNRKHKAQAPAAAMPPMPPMPEQKPQK